MRTSALTAALLLAGVTAAAADSAFVDALKAHQSTLSLENGRLSGAGASALVADAKESEFFLIGEDHGGAESSQFAAAMYAALQPAGYRHIAVEAGPLTAARLEAIGNVEAIGRFSVAHPFALPFFDWREEAEYLVSAVKHRGPKVKRVVWGLDQEFVLSPSLHLERLAQLASTPAAKKAVADWSERRQAGDREMTGKHNPAAVLMMTAKPAEFDALAAAFAGNGEAQRIIAELKESAAIYQLWMERKGYESNLRRSLLMKRNFRRMYDEAVAGGETHPRVLLKFGMNHMVRGRSEVNVFDIGTMLPEIAALNGMRASNVLILYRKGHVNELTPFGGDPSARSAEYNPLQSRNLGFDATPLFDAASEHEWTLYDMRAIRPMIGKNMPVDEALGRIVWGFDWIVIVPEVHPATLFE